MVFATMVFYACKKDNNVPASIIGTWIASYNYPKAEIFNQTYIFKSDSTVQITRTVIDSASGKLLGYQYLSNGKFHLNGEQLKLYQLNTLYYNSQSGVNYVPITQLTSFKTDTLQTYTIKINPNNTSFYFYFPPCPASALCVMQFTYKRQ